MQNLFKLSITIQCVLSGISTALKSFSLELGALSAFSPIENVRNNQMWTFSQNRIQKNPRYPSD